MIILVCGGRDYTDCNRLYAKLNTLHKASPLKAVVHGNAPGADTLAGVWARDNKVQERTYDADWQKHGKAAGPIRNQLMLDSEAIDLVVAFPGGRGTADMIRRAQKKGIEVVVVDPKAL